MWGDAIATTVHACIPSTPGPRSGGTPPPVTSGGGGGGGQQRSQVGWWWGREGEREVTSGQRVTAALAGLCPGLTTADPALDLHSPLSFSTGPFPASGARRVVMAQVTSAPLHHPGRLAAGAVRTDCVILTVKNTTLDVRGPTRIQAREHEQARECLCVCGGGGGGVAPPHRRTYSDDQDGQSGAPIFLNPLVRPCWWRRALDDCQVCMSLRHRALPGLDRRQGARPACSCALEPVQSTPPLATVGPVVHTRARSLARQRPV